MKDVKKYYWIKLQTNFFGLDEIDFLLSQKNGSDYVVLYQMLCMMTANNGGELCSQIGDILIPYDVDKIVREAKHFSRETVLVALELFKNLGLIYVQENDVLKIPEVAGMVGTSSASDEAIRKRKYREKLKEQEKKLLPDNIENDVETKCPTKNGTKSPTEYRDKRLEYRDKRLDKEIDIEKELEKETKHKYGEYQNVLLSDSELEKLKKDFPNDYQERIERVSSYVASTGKTYKSYLATIRNWARNEKKDEKPKSYDTDKVKERARQPIVYKKEVAK